VIVRQEDHKSVEVLEFEAMNTNFFVSISNSCIPNWQEQMLDWFRYVEHDWSRFNEDSELTLINQIAIGETINVSPPLFDVLLKAQNYFSITDGLFSPYLLEQIMHQGYDRSFPFQKSEDKGPGIFQQSIPFRFNPEESAVERIAEGKIDLGGIGKGYAVESAAVWLKQATHADFGIVDGGGDLTVWSNGEKEWKIGIVHPLAPEKEIKQITLKNGSVATSNIVYRSWLQGGERKHHILNGKTGKPVDSGIIQATAVTTNCLDAEVFAKLCFMEEGAKLKELLGTINPIFKLVLVNESGEILTTQ
jgi:FAD:protein FMN transferase